MVSGTLKTLKRLLLISAIALLVVYIGSYFVLSRRGYAEADEFKMHGFYYFLPEDSDAWRAKNYRCVLLFSPINALDRALGTGRQPATEPLFRLSAR